MKILFGLLLLLFTTLSANATHIISEELTYEYLGDSNYLIRVEHIDWCGGTIWTGGNPPVGAYYSIAIFCKSAYSGSTSYSIPLTSVKEYPVYSWAGQSYNSCGSSGNNGYTGFQVATYDTIINLGSIVGGCDTVRVNVATGARSSAVNLIGQASYYTYFDIDLANPNENSSVKSFKFDTPAAFTDSADYDFSVAMFDLDGDSLTYELVDGWNTYILSLDLLNPLAYSTGYSGAQPANGLTLNPLSGQISFATEIPIGYDYANYVLNIKTSEWDPESGDLVQETFRDIQFFVLPFAGNNNPIWDDLNTVVNAKHVDSLSVRVCAGDTFSFNVEFSDVDATDTLNVFSNLEFIADYYNITQTGINPTTATIKAVINKTYTYGFDAIVKAFDTHNPMLGQTSKAIHITSVGPISETVYACYSNWDTISTQADSISIWSVLSGDTMNAQNFNCLNTACTEVELNPFNSTTYLVENYMTGNCSFTDTIVVQTEPAILNGTALDTAQNPIANSKVYRFQYDVGQDSVYLLDSTVTDAQGNYDFALGIDSFLIKVVPNFSSYPLILPTYYDQKVVVPQADFIYPAYCDTLSITNICLFGVNTAGIGFISGIVSQGAGRGVGDPVSGVPMVLMKDETPIEMKKTDQEGMFKFEGLAVGEYEVFVDRWGIDNSLAPSITLTDTMLEVDSLQFYLYSNHLELVKSTGIEDVESHLIQLYPNPTTGVVQLESQFEVSNIKVFDQLGRLQLERNAAAKSATLDLSALVSGIYFIEIEDLQGHREQFDVVVQR